MDKFLIEIPMDAYLRCLAKFDDNSLEYRMLRNGIVLRGRTTKDSVLHLRCDAIRQIIADECPEFLESVQRYPDLPIPSRPA